MLEISGAGLRSCALSTAFHSPTSRHLLCRRDCSTTSTGSFLRARSIAIHKLEKNPASLPTQCAQPGLGQFTIIRLASEWLDIMAVKIGIGTVIPTPGLEVLTGR